MRRGFSPVLVVLLVFILLLIVGLLLTFKKPSLLTNKIIGNDQTATNYSYPCDLPSPIPSPITKEVFDKYNACKPVSIFLKENTSEEAIKMLVQEIETMENVGSVNYISKEKALEIYKERNKDEPLLLESITANMLPDSIEVKIKDPLAREKVLNFSKSKTFVESVI